MNMHMASTVLGPRRRLPALPAGSTTDSVQSPVRKGDKKTAQIKFHPVAPGGADQEGNRRRYLRHG